MIFTLFRFFRQLAVGWLLLFTSFGACANAVSGPADVLHWQKFDGASFQQAQAEDKYLLLDLVAVWCHWCHVMEEKTYRDPRVVQLIQQHFVPVQADHDLRPDLAERYRDWGWPATIILRADGTEIVKRAGYISPDKMARLLQAVIDDPSPEASTLSLPDQLSSSPLLSSSGLKTLQRRHLEAYDAALGGLKLGQKFLDAESVEWDLWLAQHNDPAAAKRAVQTLTAARQLIDPEFGGAYQYSTYGDWDHPHYEKIMKTQQKFLNIYSQACVQLKNTEDCQAAREVGDYLIHFLFSPENGAFYTSQDADLVQGEKAHDYFSLKKKARLAIGLPRIDKHHYAAHNGRAIEGLASLYLATQEKRYLEKALQAATWVIKNRGYYGGGFRHDKRDAAGPYLADTLYMGKALLKLYEATGQKVFLSKASRAAEFIGKQFKNPDGGLLSAVDNGTPAQPLPQLDQNIDAARFFIRLFQQTGQLGQRALAEHTMKFLATDSVATARLTDAGILLVMQEYQAASVPTQSALKP
ncbi:MAG TPA: thioredoxin domain-containing protein [Gammaproteobacteria bacterium]|nr:thioredoxin domain-containing protein [Gammaproteobacteria bacterium]